MYISIGIMYLLLWLLAIVVVDEVTRRDRDVIDKILINIFRPLVFLYWIIFLLIEIVKAVYKD